MIEAAAKRLYGFELQFGAFAVAQLRLLAEMIDLNASGSPALFVTDTLADPYAAHETGQGIYREISKSQSMAAEIKRSTPITVVIGNPPYKNAAMGKGAWIENGSGNRAAPLADWQPPRDWGVGNDAKNLRNLYVYFWRWASWKVFEQGAGGRDKQPPVSAKLSGLVCYITVSGFLNGPGFQKMRSDLRRDCDEIWVIDCSPEGHQPKVPTRIFQGVMHPVCIVLASRSPANNPHNPARVRFRAVAKGQRAAKFTELESIVLDSTDWSDCPSEWRAPFLPEFSDIWGSFPAIDQMLGDSGLGSMSGRTWIMSPDADSLSRRWKMLISEADAKQRALMFHPHLRKGKPGDKHIAKATIGLGKHHKPVASLETALKKLEVKPNDPEALAASTMLTPIRYGFRSFDRQWIIPDNRLINQPSPTLWDIESSEQVYLTALSRSSPRAGPGATLTAHLPDHDHFKGSASGRVFALWKDDEAKHANIAPGVIAELTKAFGEIIDPIDIFAYVAGIITHPAYTAAFRADLIRPGLRVPLTADATLFAEAAALGREVIWLHSFGERFADGKPVGPPRLTDERKPSVPANGAIPTTPDDFPDSIDYDPQTQRLKIGKGFIDRVPPAVWAYEVSGKSVLRQWFSYRRKTRDRPQIGDKRKPSPLSGIQPDHWLPEYTSELINVLNVLGLLVDLEPKQADVLKRICDGPLIPASRFM